MSGAHAKEQILTFLMMMIEWHQETREDKEYKYQQHRSHSWAVVIKILLEGKLKNEALNFFFLQV